MHQLPIEEPQEQTLLSIVLPDASLADQTEEFARRFGDELVELSFRLDGSILEVSTPEELDVEEYRLLLTDLEEALTAGTQDNPAEQLKPTRFGLRQPLFQDAETQSRLTSTYDIRALPSDFNLLYLRSVAANLQAVRIPLGDQAYELTFGEPLLAEAKTLGLTPLSIHELRQAAVAYREEEDAFWDETFRQAHPKYHQELQSMHAEKRRLNAALLGSFTEAEETERVETELAAVEASITSHIQVSETFNATLEGFFERVQVASTEHREDLKASKLLQQTFPSGFPVYLAAAQAEGKVAAAAYFPITSPTKHTRITRIMREAGRDGRLMKSVEKYGGEVELDVHQELQRLSVWIPEKVSEATFKRVTATLESAIMHAYQNHLEAGMPSQLHLMMNIEHHVSQSQTRDRATPDHIRRLDQVVRRVMYENPGLKGSAVREKVEAEFGELSKNQWTGSYKRLRSKNKIASVGNRNATRWYDVRSEEYQAAQASQDRTIEDVADDIEAAIRAEQGLPKSTLSESVSEDTGNISSYQWTKATRLLKGEGRAATVRVGKLHFWYITGSEEHEAAIERAQRDPDSARLEPLIIQALTEEDGQGRSSLIRSISEELGEVSFDDYRRATVALRDAGKIEMEGFKGGARWYLAKT